MKIEYLGFIPMMLFICYSIGQAASDDFDHETWYSKIGMGFLLLLFFIGLALAVLIFILLPLNWALGALPKP